MPGRSSLAAYSAVRARDDGQAKAVAFEHSRRARPLGVRSGTDCPDAGRIEMGERVEQRVRPEVERVVVGERDAVDAEVRECLRRPGRRAEVEDSPRKRLAAGGDAAFEVEETEVGLGDGVDNLARKQRLGR